VNQTDKCDDRLHVLLNQLDGAWEMLDARLTGRRPWRDEPGDGETDLTDEEFFWEPVEGCWSLRRRGEATSAAPVGKGDWVLDHESPPPQPAPFTTIAWRLCHVCVSPLMRYDYTFGSHSLTLDEITWPSTARDAVAFLRQSHERWRTALEGMTSADLDQIGRSQFPQGLDPQVRFVDLLAWTNLEFAHHAAEIACLRDLYGTSLGRSHHPR
jgi:hypothetical protein